jgi:hypothetical protein
MTKVRAVQGSMFPDIQPDKPIGKILPSVFVGTNADLMAAVAPFYLTGSVLDVTYGNGDTAGGWWRRFTPPDFAYHDLALDGVDFRALPHGADEFDTVCFDPPYVHSGTAATTAGAEAFRKRFGLSAAFAPSGVLPLILEGLDDVCRVARRFVLVKCMEFAQGYRFHDIPTAVTMRCAEVGWVKHDQIVHHTGSGPGGSNIFDPARARRHHSYLIVFAPSELRGPFLKIDAKWRDA